MKIVKYNHFDSNTHEIAEGEAISEAYLILETGDATPADYTEITGDIEELHLIHKQRIIDYLTATILIKTACATAGFLTLTAEQQVIVAKYLGTDNAALITYYEGLGNDTATATGLLLVSATYHATANAKACMDRHENKEGVNGWYIIMLSHFSQSEAVKMLNVADKYISRYTKYAEFGEGYGDPLPGFLNFINNTGTITESIEDFTLISGVDFTAVKAALTKYFFI